MSWSVASSIVMETFYPKRLNSYTLLWSPEVDVSIKISQGQNIMEYRILIIGIRFYIKKSKNCSATTAGKDSKIMTMESSIESGSNRWKQRSRSIYLLILHVELVILH